jgi:hypothetical protein
MATLADGFTFDPNEFTVLNDVLYFLAGEEPSGAELCACDPECSATAL